MTLVQLSYIVAVNDYKSFANAAKGCFVTQPTLSMQIQKLEEEFLKKYCLQMPRTTLRYAIEKFEEKKRQFYLNQKS